MKVESLGCEVGCRLLTSMVQYGADGLVRRVLEWQVTLFFALCLPDLAKAASRKHCKIYTIF